MFRLTRIFESPTEHHYFFGYFNTPQVSADSQRILALRVKTIDAIPGPSDTAEVGWFSLSTNPNRFHKIGETNSYNWQQGAMLQFLGPDYKDQVCWNFFDGLSYKTRIHDFRSDTSRVVPAIYNPSPQGDVAVTIDFERHAWCRRGYSYGNVMMDSKNNAIVDGEAIWLFDMHTSEKTELISLKELLKFNSLSTMNGATHYLEHSTFSPSGNQIAFLHRWKHSNGIHSRFFVVNTDGSNLRMINDSGRMSHFCWYSESKLLGYGGKSNPFNSLRKNKTFVKSLFKILLPIYKKFVHDSSGIGKSLTGDGYYLFDVNNTKVHKSVVPSLRSEDGHPIMLHDKRYFITDTYARSEFGQLPKLLLGDIETGQSTLLATLDSIDRYDETPLRCDLHPCLSPCGTIISIDTMDGGKRKAYAYRLERTDA